MSRKTVLLFGIHMHQPVDNFKEVIERAVESCYAPFFEVMSRYPEFRFSVHCSGWLMEEIRKEHSELFRTIQALAREGSIEFFSAGYYEPILSVIPSRDRVVQIEKLNSAVEKHFAQRPRGAWLTERVWESSLIPDLGRAGIAYTVMDDYHFQCAGFDEAVLDGYYMTEEGGEKLALFPISQKLRYAIPFLSVESAVNAIKSYNREEDSAAVIFDDAEKFGMWPGTYEWVYEKKWLENFVRTVLEEEEIETMHYGAYLEANRTRGIAYVPNVSYYEMGEWSLRADDARVLERLKEEMGQERYEKEGVKFLKGGIWKNFFVKYEESNRLHKRMLELSAAREKVNRKAYDDLLYRLQTNDALWHGVFGGLYLPNLRDNAYRYLIEAEALRYKGRTSIEADENEMDGYVKIKAVTPQCLFRFDAAWGGQMVEFDLLSKGFNWQNTLTRREELYHQKVLEGQKEEAPENSEEKDGIDTIHNAAMTVDQEMKDALIYDWYLKNSFIDHISDESFNLENFRHADFREYGDFANQPFVPDFDRNRINFKREGGIYSPQKDEAVLQKSYLPKERGFDFSIMFNTRSERALQYVLELNLHFADYEDLRINGECLGRGGMQRAVRKVVLFDAYLQKNVMVTLDKPVDLFFFPLETLSQSEKGFDLTIQGVSLALARPFRGNFVLKGTVEVCDV
jgi:alpha-amylase/alpha-mannosidase (GH57 family)